MICSPEKQFSCDNMMEFRSYYCLERVSSFWYQSPLPAQELMLSDGFKSC